LAMKLTTLDILFRGSNGQLNDAMETKGVRQIILMSFAIGMSEILLYLVLNIVKVDVRDHRDINDDTFELLNSTVRVTVMESQAGRGFLRFLHSTVYNLTGLIHLVAQTWHHTPLGQNSRTTDAVTGEESRSSRAYKYFAIPLLDNTSVIELVHIITLGTMTMLVEPEVSTTSDYVIWVIFWIILTPIASRFAISAREHCSLGYGSQSSDLYSLIWGITRAMSLISLAAVIIGGILFASNIQTSRNIVPNLELDIDIEPVEIARPIIRQAAILSAWLQALTMVETLSFGYMFTVATGLIPRHTLERGSIVQYPTVVLFITFLIFLGLMFWTAALIQTDDDVINLTYVHQSDWVTTLIIGATAVALLCPVLLRKFTTLYSKLISATETYDVFLSHDWGTDELKRNNHARVAGINSRLQEMGFTTWFDAEKMTGNIGEKMAAGIENSAVVLCFATKKYCDKVGEIRSPENPDPNPADNCKKEFNHAVLKKKPMVAVVMEPRMRDTSGWNGNFGIELGSNLYVDMVDDSSLHDQCNHLAERIRERM